MNSNIRAHRKLQVERLGDRLMMAADTVSERPISDWIDAQKDTGAWGNDADVNRDGIFGSSPADQHRYRVQFDWFGLQNKEYSLGLKTQITGSVHERRIGDADGDGDDDVLVTVDMHSENVNIFVQDLAIKPNTLLFGDDPTDQSDDEAALATVDFRIEFIVDDMGLPLPSWGPFTAGTGSLLDQDFLVLGNELPRTQRFELNVKAEGALTDAGAAFFGVEEGTRAKLHWAKPGLYAVPPVGDNLLAAFAGNAQNRGAGRIYPSSGFVFKPMG